MKNPGFMSYSDISVKRYFLGKRGNYEILFRRI